MPQTLGYVSVVVRNYDEAIAFFTGILGFTLIEDTPLGNGNAGFWCVRRIRKGQAYCLPEPSTPNKMAGLEIKLAAAYSSFSIPMISGETMRFSGNAASNSARNPGTNPTARLQSSKICTEINGTCCS